MLKHLEIVDFLQRYFSFSVEDGTSIIFFSFEQIPSFQALGDLNWLVDRSTQEIGYHYAVVAPNGFFLQMLSTLESLPLH